MYFANPYALFGLFAIVIPILIHLFNFRKYKTVFFSNVHFLQEVYSETKRQSKIKHLVILALRILAVIAIVLAFAQPYIPQNKTNTTSQNKIIGLYIDNSFSTDALTQKTSVLEDEKNKALELIKSYPLNTKYILITNDLNPKHSRPLTSAELTNEIENIKVCPSTILLSDIYKILDTRLHRISNNGTSIFLCSDFQKSTADLATLQNLQPQIPTYLVPSYLKNT